MKPSKPEKWSTPVIRRTEPPELETIRDFQKRIPAWKTEKIEELSTHMRSIQIGYFGEQKVDHMLEGILLPEPYIIIPNYHARISPKRYVQIDTLIVTAKFILHLEIKHYRGKIEFLHNPSRIRRVDKESEDYFSCPLTQIHRNHYALRMLFKPLKPQLPIFHALVFSHRKCELVTSDKRSTILFPNQLEAHLAKLSQLPVTVTEMEWKQLVKHLKDFQTPFLFENFCVKQGLTLEEIERGIFCKECPGKLVPNYRHWRCSMCHLKERNPVPRSLHHVLQYDETLQTPHQIREYLDITSQKVLYRAQQKIAAIVSSSGKGVRYSVNRNFSIPSKSE